MHPECRASTKSSPTYIVAPAAPPKPKAWGRADWSFGGIGIASFRTTPLFAASSKPRASLKVLQRFLIFFLLNLSPNHASSIGGRDESQHNGRPATVARTRTRLGHGRHPCPLCR